MASEYRAEDYISLIEQGRRDKISPYALDLIATRFRELEKSDKLLEFLKQEGVEYWEGYNEACDKI